MFARNKQRKRKPRNTRAKNRNERARLHQLDVRMRSRAENRQRLVEFSKLLLRVSCVIGAVVATYYSSRWIYNKAFYQNDEFALTDLRIESDGELGYQRIVEEAKIEEGVNLIRVDLDAVRERLTALPRVGKVEIHRELPNSLSVRVFERSPVAWLACPSMGIRSRTSQRGFMLDADGVVIPCEALLRKYLNLPVVRALSLPRVKPGSVIESEQVLASLSLIDRSNEVFLEEQLEVVEVEIRNGYSFRAYYNNDAEVTFGLEDIEDQLNDLKLILGHAAAKNRHVATLNLMPRKNIPVTYFNTSGTGMEIMAPQVEPAAGPVPAVTPAGAAPASGGSEGTDDRLKAIRAILGRG